MTFDELIAPLTRQGFLDRFEQGACFFVRGTLDKFRDLITLQEIEDRLNEGCNLNSPVNMVLDNGQRAPLVNKDNYWTPQSLRKTEILELLESRHSFLMMNMSQINPRVAELIDGIEGIFADRNLHADLHLYVSASRDASGYNAHRDRPQHKLYLQVIGATDWQVFDTRPGVTEDVVAVPAEQEADTLEPKAGFTLNPGDLFYMPPGVFHKVRNRGGPRVSFSIPFAPARPGQKRVDRRHIPFRAMFEQELREAAADPQAADTETGVWIRQS